MSETTRRFQIPESHAALVAELTDHRGHVKALLAAIRKAVPALPPAYRVELLNVALEVESKIS